MMNYEGLVMAGEYLTVQCQLFGKNESVMDFELRKSKSVISSDV